MRQWDSRNEGPLAFWARLVQHASIQEVSEYSWLRLMGRQAEAEIVLERFVEILRKELPREIPVRSHETCERALAKVARTHGAILDDPFIAALRERLRR
jgi:hypothetical protein